MICLLDRCVLKFVTWETIISSLVWYHENKLKAVSFTSHLFNSLTMLQVIIFYARGTFNMVSF